MNGWWLGVPPRLIFGHLHIRSRHDEKTTLWHYHVLPTFIFSVGTCPKPFFSRRWPWGLPRCSMAIRNIYGPGRSGRLLKKPRRPGLEQYSIHELSHIFPWPYQGWHFLMDIPWYTLCFVGASGTSGSILGTWNWTLWTVDWTAKRWVVMWTNKNARPTQVKFQYLKWGVPQIGVPQ